MRVSAGRDLLKNLGRAMQNGHVGLQNRVPGCFLAVQVEFLGVQIDFGPSGAVQIKFLAVQIEFLAVQIEFLVEFWAIQIEFLAVQNDF